MRKKKNILLRFGWKVYTTDMAIISYLNRSNYTHFDGCYLAYVDYNNIQDFKNEFFQEMDYLRSLGINPKEFGVSNMYEILVAVDENGEILATQNFEV